MSARYALFRWSAQLAALPGFPGEFQPCWNLQPGAQALILREQDGQQRMDLARWGLTPAWFTDFSRTPAHARLENQEDGQRLSHVADPDDLGHRVTSRQVFGARVQARKKQAGHAHEQWSQPDPGGAIRIHGVRPV